MMDDQDESEHDERSVTDEFVESIEGDTRSIRARMCLLYGLPQGVDPYDPRVAKILEDIESFHRSRSRKYGCK